MLHLTLEMLAHLGGLTPPSGHSKSRLLRKLDEMDRELQHIQTGVRQMRSAVLQDDAKALGRAATNSCNWLFSLVESYAYVERMLRRVGDDAGIGHTRQAFDRAFYKGVNLATLARMLSPNS